MKFSMNCLKYLSLLVLILLSCKFNPKLTELPEIRKELKVYDKAFIISQFNRTISLIELHKTRFGMYPETLDSLKYLGYWDKPNRFEYRKLDSGYVLNAIYDSINRMAAMEIKVQEIEIPDDFWNGLGLIESNLKK